MTDVAQIMQEINLNILVLKPERQGPLDRIWHYGMWFRNRM
jgi:hypothetical protein